MVIREVWFAVWAVGMISAASVVLGASARTHPRESAVTWNEDVAAIVAKRCVGCHRAGGFAPMSLATYDEARLWAKALAREVLHQRMPPWPAASGFSAFVDERTLTPLERELLTAWAAGGAPEGPTVPPPTEAASLPGPQLTFEVTTTAESRDVTEHVTVDTQLERAHWIGGWAFVPGHGSVESVTVRVDGNSLGTWVPPDARMHFAPGATMRVRKGARLEIDLRYRRSADRPGASHQIVLFPADARGRELRVQTFGCGTTRIDRAIEILGVRPFAADAGAPVEVLTRAPGRPLTPLVVVRSYQPRYPLTYRLRQAHSLPAGGTIVVQGNGAACGAEIEVVAGG